MSEDETASSGTRARRSLAWNQLWGLLERRAEQLGKELKFDLLWHGDPKISVEVTPIDDQLRVRVTEDMIQRAESVSETFRSQLSPQYGRGRPAFDRASKEIRGNLHKTVSLNVFASAVMVPTQMPRRTTVNVNVYQEFHIDPDVFACWLDADAQARLRGEVEAKKGNTLTLREVFRCLVEAAEEDELDQAEEGAESASGDSPWAANRNVIFFGPPGTGKSFLLANIVRKHLNAQSQRILRVTFHPEYSYYDFVGSYRPAVGWLNTTSTFTDARGSTHQQEPRTYYHFDPGPLSRALSLAAADPEEPVVLIIEEINRGNCAAIFGDVFQLLDRLLDAERATARNLQIGDSEYEIQPSAEWAAWLRAELPETNQVFSPKTGALRLPSNLYLYATMNTSDQSLFPMDTAFRRRWGMEYVGVDRHRNDQVRVPLHGDDAEGVLWWKLLNQLNREVVSHTGNDDKQMGAFFVRPVGDEALVSPDEFCAKVLFYLWSDVFHRSPNAVFREGLDAYDRIAQDYNAGRSVFRPELLQRAGFTADPSNP